MAPETSTHPQDDLRRLQRRTVAVLSLGQILGGVAFGATISLGAVLAAEISGDEAFSGLATAAVTLGTAAFAAPLVALAGVALVVVGAAASLFPLLLFAFALIGAGQASNLQSRFAATDLATAASRGRDLSIVVWATTIGAVLGPNLVGPGEALGALMGMPALTGPYLFTVAGQGLAILLYLIALRPDPLLTAQAAVAADRSGATRPIAGTDRPRVARYAIVVVAAAHGVMVSVMAMTPVHLLHHGATLTIVGVTISLHIAGMYALAPVFGILADRWGRMPTILLGQALLAASLVLAFLGQDSTVAVTFALVLLGLGWSAATVAGAALLTEASDEARRTRRQGLSDTVMSLVGAGGAIAAGVILGWIGYGGLALVVGMGVLVAVALAPTARSSAPQSEATPT